MIVEIELLSDAIFGSGQSIPGAEDIALYHDDFGFPVINGTNIKGNLRESLGNLAAWKGESEQLIKDIFGRADDHGYEGENKEQIIVSDFMLPYELRQEICEELKIDSENTQNEKADEILDLFTNMRTFTKLENGVAKNGSLRCARCINKGYVFYGEIICEKKYEDIVKEALMSIKWLGTMRTRGFGQVKISVKGA